MGLTDRLAPSPQAVESVLLNQINHRFSTRGISISHEDARKLAEARALVLTEVERIEFGTPAIVAIAEAVALSPNLDLDDLASNLVRLQSVFYALRDELPPHVPDSEIIDALRGGLDTWGETNILSSMTAEEVMCHSKEYRRNLENEGDGIYRIADDAGHIYAYNEREWEYDEQACGWDGERWTDDYND